jgi:hypothetical protein
VSWWREGDQEVDFVVRSGTRVWAIEVKSGRRGPRSALGLTTFCRRHREARPLVVGPGGITLEEFLSTDPAVLLQTLLDPDPRALEE